MKIIYNIRSTANSGGMERMLCVKTNWLVNAGYEVIIITTDQQGAPSFFEFDSRIRFFDLGINYRQDDSLSYKEKQKLHKKLLEKFLFAEKADICVSMYCDDVSILHKISDGSKKIVEFHFCKDKNIKRRLMRRLFHKYAMWRWDSLAAKYDRIVLLTEKDAACWHTRNKVVIPNAVLLRGDTPARLLNKTVIAVGRYVYQKGFEDLITAWKSIPEGLRTDGWQLKIVGSGELEDSYRKLMSDLNLEESIHLGKAESDMTTIYQEASIMAATSRYEGLPLALIEAQSFGIPVVSFDCNCGPSEIIDAQVTGYLIKPSDINDLAQKLTALMENETLRKEMGERAFERSKRFLPDKIMGKWVNLFNELVNN